MLNKASKKQISIQFKMETSNAIKDSQQQGVK
jgi:hypothetical protein